MAGLVSWWLAWRRQVSPPGTVTLAACYMHGGLFRADPVRNLTVLRGGKRFYICPECEGTLDGQRARLALPPARRDARIR